MSNWGTRFALTPTNQESQANSMACVTQSASNLLVNSVILNHNNTRTLSLPRTIRPNRPPDYETTLKRIGLMRTDRSTWRPISHHSDGDSTWRPISHHSDGDNRPASSCSINVNVNLNVNMNVNAICIQHSPPFPPPPPPHLLMVDLEEASLSSLPPLPSPQSLSSDSSDSVNSNAHHSHHHNSRYKPTRYFDKKKSNSRVKKSVSFSDHVILVACAEEEPEEYIPNPIMERVLGKAFFNNIQ